MYGRSLLLLSCLTFLVSGAFAGESALLAEDLTLSDSDKAPSLAGAEYKNLPTIAPIDLVYIGAGNTWEFYLRGRMPSGETPTLIGVALPSGAVMTEVGDGWSLVYWQPSNEDVGRHLLTIRLMDNSNPNLLIERDIEVEVKPSANNHESLAMVPAAANPDGSSVNATGAKRQPPTLGPIATHIISAGKTLSVRLTPEHDNVLPPIIQIDRLPPNASFDANEDGSRTFYWPTGDSDQGQHRFRLTVIHPEDASLKTVREMTVIVGDPSQQVTMPADR